MCAYDFETAFPSVIHAWIWLVLKFRKLPLHYIILFQGIYHNANATFSHNGQTYTIINFLAGVLQGCPGSAFLFNNSLDPFLNLLNNTLREANRGISRACADDIGLCLSRLKHMQLLFPIFESAKKLAGLTLKPQKCIIVPLCELSEKVKNDISKWLKRNIPDWQQFCVKDATKLLGFYIGPKAGKLNWVEVVSKVRERIRTIQGSSASVSINAHTFNTRILPVTSYVAQLLPLPPKFMQFERGCLHTVLRMPQNSLCHGDLLNLDRLGGPKLRSMAAACVAANVRTSLKTVTSWAQWIPQLKQAAESCLPLGPLVKEVLTTACWDSPPIALSLSEAAGGMQKEPRWAPALGEVISKLAGNLTSKTPIQKLIYKALASKSFINSLDVTISRRLSGLFQPYSLDFQNSILLDVCFATLKKNSVSVATKVIKTWTNAWATSYRYHEGIKLPCLFGCSNSRDDQGHYFNCPHIFALWKFIASEVDSDPLVRWGLVLPSNSSFLQIACVFSAYHAVRREFKRCNQFFNPDCTQISGAILRKSWTVFAEAFFVEAREVGIDAKRFSVPSFLNFIANQGALTMPLNSSGSPGDPAFGAVQVIQTVQDAVGPFQNFPASIHSNI